ncbi:MAG: hypothetical protein ACOVRN_13875, partial [Flavobacterium sp.]
ILSMFLLGLAGATAQTIYSESFGTPTQTGNQWPLVTAYTGYDNTSVTYSGTASARNNVNSTGYAGATGAGNIYFGSAQIFEVTGISTSAYNTANLNFSFGEYQSATSTTASDNLKLEVSTDGTNYTQIPYTRSTTTSGWNLITVNGGVIPSTANLHIRFTQTSTLQYRIDDLKLANVSANCTIALGAATTACDAATYGTDTYTATIPFTGAGNAAYVVSATAGTVGGDNPATTAEGNIVISGITENTNINITVTSTADCTQTLAVTGVYCKPVNALPYSESFGYTEASILTNTEKWWAGNSGDDVVITSPGLTYAGLPSSGNAALFGGAGKEAFTPFTSTTSGTVYASFLINLDQTNITTDGTATYFAAFLSSNTDVAAYAARFFYKKSGDQFVLGIGSAADITLASYTTTLYNTGSTVLVIASYDFTNNVINAWINPTVAGFNGTATPTLTFTPTTAFTTLGGFVLRQEDTAKTPNITFDELRIGTAAADVVTDTASVAQNEIDGLRMFP